MQIGLDFRELIPQNLSFSSVLDKYYSKSIVVATLTANGLFIGIATFLLHPVWVPVSHSQFESLKLRVCRRINSCEYDCEPLCPPSHFILS